MKSVFFLICCIFLISFVSADCVDISTSCLPDSGYDYCSHQSWNCDGAISSARIQISSIQTDGEQHGQYSTGDTYIDFSYDGDYGYFNENIPFNFWFESNCNEYGCAGGDLFGASRQGLTNNPGDHYTDCPMFYAFDRADYNGFWSTSYAAIGWFGSGNCNDIRQVECFDDSDCSGSLICDKSGSWETWSCENAPVECPDTLNYNPSLPIDINGCLIWQNFQQYSHCSGGWFIYNPNPSAPSTLQMSEGQYRSIAPPSCWQTACTEDWECSEWSDCDGQQTRSCSDNNNCGTIETRPSLTQSCQVECPNSLDYNPDLPVDISDCAIWQNFEEFSHCSGGWFLYTPNGPSNLVVSGEDYQLLVPVSCWMEEEELTYYRFLSNQCYEVTIFQSEKTEDDYNTLAECESQIDDGNGDGDQTENIWETVWFEQFGIEFTLPILITSFTILVFVLKILRKR